MDESDSDLLLCMMAYHVSQQTPTHSCFKKRYYKKLSYYQQKLRDKRIPQQALQNPKESAWRILLRPGNDHALITLTVLDYESFNW